MSVAKHSLISALSSSIPSEVLTNMLDEYQHIKQQFFLQRFQPSELNGARFGECVVRLLEHLDKGNYTPFGSSLNTESVINKVGNNTNLQDTLRFFIPRLTRVILDVRNKRDVAHVGGEVNPNRSDALFVVQSTDWILTEIVRHFYGCSKQDAQEIVDEINEVRIPVVAEIDDFVRVQNTKLDTSDKVLLILYHKSPSKVDDSDLVKWTKYKNASRLKSSVLQDLDSKALIHYAEGNCSLLPKGARFVEKNIALDLLI